MIAETMKLLVGSTFLVLGAGFILFSGWNGGINAGNIVVGFAICLIGMVLTVNTTAAKELSPNNEVITKSSKEKTTTDGDHVTVEEEFTTRKIKNESSVAM
ncbi:MAG: hypothetical protein WCW44_02950 [archaeon]